jgi:hypothetical protein
MPFINVIPIIWYGIKNSQLIIMCAAMRVHIFKSCSYFINIKWIGHAGGHRTDSKLYVVMCREQLSREKKQWLK